MSPVDDIPDIHALGKQLAEAASQANQRRLVVLHGSRDRTLQAAADLLEAAGVEPDACSLVGRGSMAPLVGKPLAPSQAERLMGTTNAALVLDAHASSSPNTLGRTIGSVDGGGLVVLCTPGLEAWADHRDAFDEHLAVHPYTVDDVSSHMRERLVRTLSQHDGILVVDVGRDRVDRERVDGDAQAPSRSTAGASPRDPPPGSRFPPAAYEACRTSDQAGALGTLERLAEPGGLVVIEADRGRGKSSACGLAAGALAAEGARVLVTAPSLSNAREVLSRAMEIGALLDEVVPTGTGERSVELAGGGTVCFERPALAAEHAEGWDAIIVDEAAAIPVQLLSDLLDAGPPIAYATTVRGYEGTGRGFSVRFKDRLDASDRACRTVRLDEPIRYAAGDPVERWVNHALLLDARPAVDGLVAQASPTGVDYEVLDADRLARDEALLREVFGLLVFAHYRTSPDDLARLLDAPNLTCHALTLDGHVASVALVAEEGGLPEGLRARMYDGDRGRVQGHLVPNVLTSQLRNLEAGEPTGDRVVRIATHHAVRSRGLGTHLLEAIREGSSQDWLGTIFGATPELVRFWGSAGYHAVHVSTSRNPSSGEHSTLLLHGLTPEGDSLVTAETDWLLERLPAQLTDGLSHVDPDVVRATLSTLHAEIELDLTERAWRLVASAAAGPGLFDVDPAPFRRLALKHLVEHAGDLDDRSERLLVTKVLQARDWEETVKALGFHSRREAMLALGDALAPLVERYGPKAAREEMARYQ